MDSAEFTAQAKEFQPLASEFIKRSTAKQKEFLARFPFRAQPNQIDALTPEIIYSPGGDADHFVAWVEHRTKELGRLGVGSALYAESARDNHEKFKTLLRKVVDDSVPFAEKVDLPWEQLPGFGGDKTIAKKIVTLYHPDELLPIFKTADLEHFAKHFGLDYQGDAYKLHGKSYEALSIGQRFELLNDLLLRFKKAHEVVANWNNATFVRLLYQSDTLHPQKQTIAPRRIEALHALGLLFEPTYEQEVVYLFSVLHRDLGFPYVVTVRPGFPDAEVLDSKKRRRLIEFEVRASDFIQHNHDPKGCDLIICWENDLEDSEGLPEIIALRDFIRES